MITLLASPAWAALTLLESGFTTETFATYSASGIDAPYSMTADNNGNLYLTHRSAGSIWRVTPQGQGTQFVTGLDEPRAIEWTGGTSYGNYLYVTCDRDIKKVGLDGTPSNFSYISGIPTAMGLDRTGNYGSYLYASTGGQDHTYRVTTSGGVTLFSNWPGWTDGGSPRAIKFDPGNSYGGLMYAAASFVGTNQDDSGLFSLDTSGSAARFTADLVTALGIDFDLLGNFGSDMFVTGKNSWADDYSIWRVAPNGTATEFATTTISSPTTMGFGPDGAMYISEYSDVDDMITISRVVPEPATILLLGLGGMLLQKKR